MVHLEALLEAAQDGDGVLHRGRIHGHGLEPPLQGLVLLHVRAVLVERGGADAVEFTPGQHGLEHVARVHGTFRPARTHDVVHLVDEEQDPSLAGLDLVQDRLEPLLELAPVLGAGHERSHVQGEDRLVLEPLGHVAAHDALGQSLHDGGLAHAGLADEDGVVLGLAGQDAHHAPDLVVATDDRIELAQLGLGHQVDAVLFQGFVGGLRVVAGDPLVATDGCERLQETFLGDIEPGEDLRRRGGLALVDHGKEQVLYRHVLVLEAGRLVLGLDQDLAEPLGDHDLAGLCTRSRHPGFALEFLDDFCGKAGQRHVHLGEQPGHEAVGLLHEGQQQVLHVDLGVTEAHRGVLRVGDGLLRLLRELVHIHCSLRSFDPS